MVANFVKVMRHDYKRALQAIQNALASGLIGDDPLNAAFEENSRDVARIGGVRNLSELAMNVFALWVLLTRHFCLLMD
jgi:hypothetical protein